MLESVILLSSAKRNASLRMNDSTIQHHFREYGNVTKSLVRNRNPFPLSNLAPQVPCQAPRVVGKVAKYSDSLGMRNGLGSDHHGGMAARESYGGMAS